MGSLNNGNPIIQSSGVLVARHMGHSVELQDYTIDSLARSANERYRLTLNAPGIVPAQSGDSGSSMATPLSFDGIIFWYDFSDADNTTIETV